MNLLKLLKKNLISENSIEVKDAFSPSALSNFYSLEKQVLELFKFAKINYKPVKYNATDVWNNFGMLKRTIDVFSSSRFKYKACSIELSMSSISFIQDINNSGELSLTVTPGEFVSNFYKKEITVSVTVKKSNDVYNNKSIFSAVLDKFKKDALKQCTIYLNETSFLELERAHAKSATSIYRDFGDDPRDKERAFARRNRMNNRNIWR